LPIQPNDEIVDKVMVRALKPDGKRKRGLMLFVIAGRPTALLVKFKIGNNDIKNAARAKDAYPVG
jgi:hypothetical protein